MKRRFLNLSILVLSSIILSCSFPKPDKIVYYHSDCLWDFTPGFFALSSSDSLLMKCWNDSELREEDIKGDVVQVEYLNNKPLSIRKLYLYGDKKIQKPFEINGNKISDIIFTQNDSSVNKITFSYFGKKVSIKPDLTNLFITDVYINCNKKSVAAKFTTKDDNENYIVKVNNKNNIAGLSYGNFSNGYIRADSVNFIKVIFKSNRLVEKQFYNGEKQILTQKCEYERDENLISTSNYDRNVRPTLYDGYFFIQFEYDKYKNIEKPALTSRNEIDWDKNVIPVSNYDKEGESSLVSDYFLIHAEHYKYQNAEKYIQTPKYGYDDNVNLISISNYDKDDRPTLYNGYFFSQLEYDKHKNVVKQSFHDLDGNLTSPIKSDGISVIKKNYDEMHNPISYSIFDKNMKPKVHEEDVYAYRATYNEKGDMIQLNFLDQNGINCEHQGAFAQCYKYDEKGNNIKVSFIDKQDRTIISDYYGCSTAEYEYDIYGNEITVNFFDDKNVSVEGYEYKYNENRILIDKQYYDYTSSTGFNTWNPVPDNRTSKIESKVRVKGI